MNNSNSDSTKPSTGTKPPEPSAQTPSDKPADLPLSPEVESFIARMADNLRTHDPEKPRGRNRR